MALQLPNGNKQIIMDNKLIRQYGTDILSYRLRTARQKKRMQYEDFDKQLIQLHKERMKLMEQIRNLGWMPLEPPVQRGYKRTFVLREDVSKSKHAELYASILEKVNNIQYSSDKRFKKKKRKLGRKIWVDRSQFLNKILSGHFEKLALSDAEKQCFYELWEMNNSFQLVKYYAVVEPWRYMLKVMPNMITKTRIKDIELETRDREIDDYLDWNMHNRRLEKILNGARYYHWKAGAKHTELYPFKNKSIHAIMDITKVELSEN
jgi:hypothetical protein